MGGSCATEGENNGMAGIDTGVRSNVEEDEDGETPCLGRVAGIFWALAKEAGSATNDGELDPFAVKSESEGIVDGDPDEGKPPSSSSASFSSGSSTRGSSAQETPLECRRLWVSSISNTPSGSCTGVRSTSSDTRRRKTLVVREWTVVEKSQESTDRWLREGCVMRLSWRCARGGRSPAKHSQERRTDYRRDLYDTH